VRPVTTRGSPLRRYSSSSSSSSSERETSATTESSRRRPAGRRGGRRTCALPTDLARRRWCRRPCGTQSTPLGGATACHRAPELAPRTRSSSRAMYVYDRRIGALESLEGLADIDAAAPTARVREPYPPSAIAFQRALDSAVRKQLVLIRGDECSGFVAVYASGREFLVSRWRTFSSRTRRFTDHSRFSTCDDGFARIFSY
jgi:hypothetical protein